MSWLQRLFERSRHLRRIISYCGINSFRNC
jgi:hypothetical protein